MTKTSTETPEVGKHGWRGQCAPGHVFHGGEVRWCSTRTFSVGIFEWIPAASGKLKRGPVKVRVSGVCTHAGFVYAKADAIVKELDALRYRGPKNVVA